MISLLNSYLGEVNLDMILLKHSINDMLNIFYDVLYTVIHMVVPQKKVSQGYFPRLFSQELKNVIILKKQAHKAFKESGSRYDYITFSRLRSQCKVLSKTCYNEFVSSSENAIVNESNVKKFWSYVNSQRKSNDLPPEMFYNKVSCQLGPDLPNLFADYFKTVYSTKVCQAVESLSFNDISINSVTN
uniref:Uncharacterized protein LOC114340620 n=1 Tax=Diabrotica virgifera virgifera TaxID=50390 RepID=A0A6P7GMI5_DIAVI